MHIGRWPSEIDKGRYRPGRDHSYTHLGSIGNPGIEEIEAKLDKAYGQLSICRHGEDSRCIEELILRSHDTQKIFKG